MKKKWLSGILLAVLLLSTPVFAGQDDYVFPNTDGHTFRLKLQTSSQAAQTLNSGATAPTTTYPYMFWQDTSTGLLKRRASDNNSWHLFVDDIKPTTTQGDMLYDNGSNLTRLPKGTEGQALRMNPGATAPEWGTLGVSAGGTGADNKTAAFDNLSPTTTAGDLIVRGALNNERLGIGTLGQVLTVTGATTIGYSTPATVQNPVTSVGWQNSSNLKAVYTSATTVTVTADQIVMPEGFSTTGSNLALGDNSSFTSTVGSWSGVNATIASVAGGQAGNALEVTRTVGSNQYTRLALSSFGLTAGKFYEARVYVKSGTSGNETFYFSAGESSPSYTPNKFVAGTSSGAWVQYKFQFKCPASPGSSYLFLGKETATAGTMLFDSVEVYELTSTFAGKLFTNVNKAAVITTAGAGGLSNGSEQASMMYHIYLIGKTDGTIDAILDTSPDGVALPAGYTYASYIGAVYNNSSGNFDLFKQVGRDISNGASPTVATGFNNTAFTAINLGTSGGVPVTAKSVRVIFYAQSANYYYTFNEGNFGSAYTTYTYAHTAPKYYTVPPLPLHDAQTIYAAVDSGAQMNVLVVGWSL
ncbi:MAG: hypothetical protein EPN22_17040 [Nitrospirae bacterium]|nr:MAG: hypothetical protein EPN22_17040 [Nitrospirota bacterium]